MTLLDELFDQNEWATLRLIEVLRKLTDEQLDRNAVGAFGSIRDTLVHLVGAEPGYITRIGGVYGGPTVPRDEWPGFDTLEAVVRASRVGLAERSNAINAEPYTWTSQDGEVISAGLVMIQAYNHATEHRSQICTILTALGVQPPELDGWVWGEATGRIREP